MSDNDLSQPSPLITVDSVTTDTTTTPRTDALLPKVAYAGDGTECEVDGFEAATIFITDWRDLLEHARTLERELAAKTAEITLLEIGFDKLREANAEILKENEALREDSERLNFLIDYCASFMNSKGEQLPENSRAAIDAARKEQK